MCVCLLVCVCVCVCVQEAVKLCSDVRCSKLAMLWNWFKCHCSKKNQWNAFYVTVRCVIAVGNNSVRRRREPISISVKLANSHCWNINHCHCSNESLHIQSLSSSWQFHFSNTVREKTNTSKKGTDYSHWDFLQSGIKTKATESYQSLGRIHWHKHDKGELKEALC